MAQTLRSTRTLPQPALDVLVVAAKAPARARLAAQVWSALPLAQIHELSRLADLVYRVAGSGVDLVLLDAEPLHPQPLTPMLVQMLKSIRPTLRIVCVARAAPPSTSATDASLSEAALGDWLRATYGSSGHGLTTGAPPAAPGA